MKRAHEEKINPENSQLLHNYLQLNLSPTPQRVNPPKMNQRQRPTEQKDWLANLYNASIRQENGGLQRYKGFILSKPQITNSNTHQTTTPVLTDDITSKLLRPLLFNDLDTCIQIAGVTSLQALMIMKDSTGMSVYQLAEKHGCNEVMATMLKSASATQQLVRMNEYKNNAQQAKVQMHKIAEQNENAALRSVIRKGSVELVKILLESEFDLKRREELITKHAQIEKSLWWCAVKSLYAEVVKILLGNVGDPNQRQILLQLIDCDGKSALQIAAKNGNPTMVRYLLQAAVDTQAIIFQVDREGMNAFMLAAAEGNTVSALIVFDMTIDKPALLNQRNKKQIYAIDLVTSQLRKKLISKLKEILKPDSCKELKTTIKTLKKIENKRS